MIRLKQIFNTGVELVHFVSVTEMDRALCGQDLAGDDIDDRGSYEMAEKTKNKVDCQDCIKIVEHCRLIKRSEYAQAVP